MPTNFRIASFNVENLFSRARVLNLADHEKVGQLLIEISKLNALIAKPTYSAADKAAIKQLVADLSYYIEIREDRGKLLSLAGNVTASGRDAWDGVIELRRAGISEQARTATADVIKALKADVLCVVEAENRPSLEQFNSQLLSTKKFPHVLVIDGNDDRGIDVGLMTKLALGSIHTHVYDRAGSRPIFSRDCLRVELQKLPNGKPLHILCNHLKSKGYGDQADNDRKRTAQTTRIAKILAENYNLATDYVLVAGDMNDTPNLPPMQPLLTVPHLHDALALGIPNAADRWTYRYDGRGNQIDYLLISEPLKQVFVKSGIERRGIWGIQAVTGETAFPSVTAKKHAASDHGAVWAEFRF